MRITPSPAAPPRHDVRDGQQLGHVDEAGVGPPPHPRHPSAQALVERAGDVAAVERQQRDEVEHADEQVEARQQSDEEHQPVDDRAGLVAGDLAGHPTGADDADGAVVGPLLEPDDRLGDVVDLDREPHQRLGDVPGHDAHLLRGVEQALLLADRASG